jgi:hypothetical protein
MLNNRVQWSSPVLPSGSTPKPHPPTSTGWVVQAGCNYSVGQSTAFMSHEEPIIMSCCIMKFDIKRAWRKHDISWELKVGGFRNVVGQYFYVQHVHLGWQLVRALKKEFCSNGCKWIPL